MRLTLIFLSFFSALSFAQTDTVKVGLNDYIIVDSKKGVNYDEWIDYKNAKEATLVKIFAFMIKIGSVAVIYHLTFTKINNI